MISKMNLYVLFDTVTGLCGPVQEDVNDAAARRRFKSTFKQNPLLTLSDYVLYNIGTIDKGSCRIVSKKPDNVYLNLDITEEIKDE